MKKDINKKIEELEKRIKDLESKPPVYVVPTYSPVYYPIYPHPYYPVYPVYTTCTQLYQNTQFCGGGTQI